MLTNTNTAKLIHHLEAANQDKAHLPRTTSLFDGVSEGRTPVTHCFSNE